MFPLDVKHILEAMRHTASVTKGKSAYLVLDCHPFTEAKKDTDRIRNFIKLCRSPEEAEKFKAIAGPPSHQFVYSKP